MSRLSGRVAVVTGGATGLGRAYARRLAEDGAQVAIADLAQAEDGDWSMRCDVSSPEAVAAFACEVEQRFGRCDVLVNNAGVYPVQPFDEITLEDWRRVLSVNLDAVFLMCKAFVPGMKARGYGRIVNVTTSVGSLVVPGFTHYVAAKLGVVGLTRALATEVGEHGITANCVCPGLVPTRGTRAGPQREWFEAVAQNQAIKRVEQPEDVVGAVSFLASDDAAFLTGQTLIVDGGAVRGGPT